MSLIYKRRSHQSTSIFQFIYDYMGEIRPFTKRIDKKRYILPLVFLKTMEFSIYRWYKAPIRRFYGVKGNELIYMITKHCNERCVKCGIWKYPEKSDEHLDVSYFLDSLKLLHHNLYQVTITGGEPLMFKEDVLKIGKESRAYGVDMIVITNGLNVTEEFLLEYKKQKHVLVFSVDTLDKDLWPVFRGSDSYDKVMKNLHLAKSILGDKLRIQSVMAKETIDEIPKIQSFCKKENILHVHQPYMDFGGNWNFTEKQSAVSGDFECAARKNICIYPNGDVVKCFDHRRIPLAKEPLGNIKNDDIISILCKRRSTEVSKIMKTCNFECKYLSCNIPADTYKV